MNKKLVAILVVIVVILLVLLMLKRRGEEPVADSAFMPVTIEELEAVPTTDPDATVPAQTPDMVVGADEADVSLIEETPEVERAVYARVNGEPVYADDVLPVQPDGAPDMEEDVVNEIASSNLRNAMEELLVVVEADRMGIALTREQEAKVEAIRKKAEYDSTYAAGQGRTLPAQSLAEVTRQQSKLTTEFLLGNIMKEMGYVPPAITETDVLAYYEANADTFGALPDDPVERDAKWRVIQNLIHVQLVSDANVQLEKQKKAYLDSLVDRADVQILP